MPNSFIYIDVGIKFTIHCTLHQKGMELDLELSPLPNRDIRDVFQLVYSINVAGLSMKYVDFLVWGCKVNSILSRGGRGLLAT